MEKDIIHILLCANSAYIPYCAVTIISLFENNKDDKFIIYLFTENVNDEDLEKLDLIGKKYNQKIKIISPPAYKLLPIQGIGKYNISAYYRLFAAELLPRNLDKVLYLDVDLIVLGPLKDIWHYINNMDLDTIAVAAVKDVVRIYDYSRLHLDHTKHSYFNSGVLLINLCYWRKNEIADLCINYISKYPERIIYADQDALNVLLCGHVKYIHPKYNCQTFYFAKNEYLSMKIWYKDLNCYNEAINSPVIIHFSGDKPWFKSFIHIPYKEIWLKYLSLTDWDISIKWKGGYKGCLKNVVKYLLLYLIGKLGSTIKRLYPINPYK